MMPKSLNELSKVVSHALRHEPWLYELELDDEGWVATGSLLSALRPLKEGWADLVEADLTEMIAQSEKKRHEIADGRIRALYGHSVAEKLLKQPAEPPETLYHGTAWKTVDAIKANGLLPMGRQYVHLSVDVLTAEAVALRKSRDFVILTVDAGAASKGGNAFYRGNDLVWLADSVPPAFIEFAQPRSS
jgi:putative RNA 2'-phosphotransferase